MGRRGAVFAAAVESLLSFVAHGAWRSGMLPRSDGAGRNRRLNGPLPELLRAALLRWARRAALASNIDLRPVLPAAFHQKFRPSFCLPRDSLGTATTAQPPPAPSADKK